MESSGKGFSNERYLREYGIDETMVTPLELAGLDPPPYDQFSTIRGENLPEAPSPAPITETGVVMGDFLDERIDDLYTRIQKLENIVDKCCDDDEFEDVQEEEPIIQTQHDDYFTDEEFLRALRVFAKDKELGAHVKKLVVKMKEKYPRKNGINVKRIREALQLIRSGKTPEVTSKPAKKFDYKTKGWIIFKSPADMASHNSMGRRKGAKNPPKNLSMFKIPLKNLGNDVNLIKQNKSVIKQGGLVWCPLNKWCGNYSTDISFTPDEFIEQVIFKPTEEELRGEWRCEIWVAPGASLKLIKEKINEGFTIEFEDENDKREVEAMQGGGYRRRNTRRKSRKRNTRRKSRKRNTRRKSRKRSSRRRSKKK